MWAELDVPCLTPPFLLWTEYRPPKMYIPKLEHQHDSICRQGPYGAN